MLKAHTIIRFRGAVTGTDRERKNRSYFAIAIDEQQKHVLREGVAQVIRELIQ